MLRSRPCSIPDSCVEEMIKEGMMGCPWVEAGRFDPSRRSRGGREGQEGGRVFGCIGTFLHIGQSKASLSLSLCGRGQKKYVWP